MFKALSDRVNNIFNKRLLIYTVVFFLFFSSVMGRLFYLQIVKYEKYKNLSENNRIRILRIKADRGFIRDRNGTLLVTNQPSYNLMATKSDIKDFDNLIKKLKDIIEIDEDLVRERYKKAYYYSTFMIYRGLKEQQLSYLLEHHEQFPGIKLDVDTVRSYYDSKSLSHIIGYMGEVTEYDLRKNKGYQVGDLIGKSGVEKVYEDELRGIDGARQVEVDSLGFVSKELSVKKPVKGKNLILSIDYDLQKAVKNIFSDKVGGVVIMNIQTGRILALYSSPTYDLNKFIPFIKKDDWDKIITNPYKPLTNRVIEDAYPPGSVFKILMAYIGLNEGVITFNTQYFCGGKLDFNGYKYGCWKKGGHGNLDLHDAIVQSCDVYFYNVGLVLGINKISEYALNFNLGKKTGIDLPNEKAGIFPTREWKKKRFHQPWYPGETIIASIGQGYISTTPIQIAVMLSALFNGGIVFKPTVVYGFEDKGFIEKKVEINNKLNINKTYAKEILDALYDTVYSKHATGYRARVSKIKIGGKTGTAQVISLKKFKDKDENEIPWKYRDHSWFAGIVPVDSPKYVIVAFVEHGGSGSKGAAPVVGAIANKLVDLGYVSIK
ncbi:penicillin-binding protein 2 [Deferribacter autotrophicus]|uniref:Penicillin-binding protein 2 n=1 Tax=Deferribacter autotrophicus TaxID=500465 RepID=A0A5A8F683_9BACT|nr:penicillin-binding protein 2 [Deferribacter autotrophicus]KAA0257383.1 penicillin-binding protein 2 [Deferribacter autotrophicus]